MYIRLQREQPRGEWLRGKLFIDGREVCSTIERTSKAILPLIYSIQVTQSPKFRRLLPILCQVPGRSGIRIHVGTKPEHSQGCILVPNRTVEEQVTQLILKAQHEHEEIRMDICSARIGDGDGLPDASGDGECE